MSVFQTVKMNLAAVLKRPQIYLVALSLSLGAGDLASFIDCIAITADYHSHST
jgi:hypothetical protein